MTSIEDDTIVARAGTDHACLDKICLDPCEVDEACANALGLPRCHVRTGRCECGPTPTASPQHPPSAPTPA